MAPVGISFYHTALHQPLKRRRRLSYLSGSIPRLLCLGYHAIILFWTKWNEMHVPLGKLEESVRFVVC